LDLGLIAGLVCELLLEINYTLQFLLTKCGICKFFSSGVTV
jgi:hypothetical protein